MIFKAMVIAFAMYSKIPMPRVEWEEKSMKYAFCFFPLIGAVIGLAVYFVAFLLNYLGIGKILFSSIMTVIPIFITGGIHFDGFLDTMDAISSYADREKRLEILKDSNSGAFAVLGGLVYFILSFGFWSEVGYKGIVLIAFGYVISRALSAISVVCFPSAKKNGLVSTFKDSADKKIVFVTMIVYLIIAFGLLFWISPISCLLCLIAALISFIIHYYNCMKNFGGISGDLAGFFLQLCELMVLFMAIIASRI